MADEPVLQGHEELVCGFTHGSAPCWRMRRSLRRRDLRTSLRCIGECGIRLILSGSLRFGFGLGLFLREDRVRSCCIGRMDLTVILVGFGQPRLVPEQSAEAV